MFGSFALGFLGHLLSLFSVLLFFGSLIAIGSGQNANLLLIFAVGLFILGRYWVYLSRHSVRVRGERQL